MANASRTRIPEEYRFTGVSMNLSTPENSTMASNFRWISAFVMPRIAPFRNTFSRPVSSGWKPVPTSSRLPTRPCSSTLPVVGTVIRERIFNSVLLPAPFWPTSPTTSPASMLKSTPRSAQMRSPLPLSGGIFSPIFQGSSSFRVRCHQRCRSSLRVPAPIIPRRYCLDTLSTRITLMPALTPLDRVHEIAFYSIEQQDPAHQDPDGEHHAVGQMADAHGPGAQEAESEGLHQRRHRVHEDDQSIPFRHR